MNIPEPLMAWHWVPFFGPRQFQVVKYRDKLNEIEWDYNRGYLVPLYDQENIFATKEECENYRGVQHR